LFLSARVSAGARQEHCRFAYYSLEIFATRSYNWRAESVVARSSLSAKENLLKIVNVLGSPRKNGTSARIARAFTETAATWGATIIDYQLNTMQYRGCQGCEGCHSRADRCVLRDDVTPLLDDLHTADIVVFSSPIYFGETCGQFKSFYDRMWSLIRTDGGEGDSSRLPPGKTAVLILSHVDSAGAHDDVLERYSMYLELYGFDVRILAASGIRIQPNADIDSWLQDASGLARELLRAE
jgi:NAD(P)H-dependent FMN reductase